MRLTIKWHVVRALALVAAILGIAVSPVWERPTPTVDANPPYTAPPVAEVFPNDEAVEAAMGTEMVRVVDSPPDSRAFALDTAAALDYRAMAVDQAWERRWYSYDEAQLVRVVAEIHTVSSLTPVVAVCDPLEELAVPGASRSGVAVSTDSVSEACASVDVGRQHFEIRVVTADANHAERAEAALRDLVPPLAEQVNPVVDLEWEGSFTQAGLRIRQVEMAGLVFALSAAIVPGLLAQLPRWRRSLTRQRTGEPNAEHIDIEAERRYQAVQLSALGAVRIALLVWALWVTFTVPALSGALATIGLLLTAYLLGIWVERHFSTDPRNRRRPRLLRGPATIPSWLGVVGTCLMLAAGIGLWTMGNALTGFGSGGAEVATWQVRGGGLSMQVLAIVVFAWSLSPISLGRRVSMAFMRDRPLEGGRPTLLLRTFGDDRLRLWVQRRDRVGYLDSLVMKRRERFEEILTFTLARYGPPIAVGQPGQLLPPGLGGQRMSFSHETWQDGVRGLSDEAALICMTVGKTQGLSWEMNHVATGGLLHRTMFVVPPVKGPARNERLWILADSYGLDPEIFDTGSRSRVVLAFCWPLGWTRPFVVVSGAADDISYDIALERCAEVLLAGEPSPSSTPEMVEEVPALPAYRDIGLPPAPRKVHSSWTWGTKLGLASMVTSSIAIPLLMPLLTGDPLGSSESMTRILTLPEAVYDVQVVGGEPESSYAVLDNHLVVRGNFSTSSVEVVGELEARSVAVRMEGDLLAYVSAGLSGEPLLVGVMDLTTGENVWTARLAERSAFVAITDTAVAVPQPVEQQLLTWDLATGRALDRIDLQCRPWDAAGHRGKVWVTCPAEGQLLAIEEGAVGETYDVPRGGTHILTAASVPYVFIAKDSVIVHPVEEDFRLWSRLPRPSLDAAEGLIAAEGVDRVSVLSQAGISRRNTLIPMSSIVVQDDGTVQYASINRWILLLTSEDQL